MRYTLALCAVLAASTHALAGDVEMTYENFQMTQTGAVEIVLKFTNNTSEKMDYVIADCALMDDSMKAITVIAVATTNVPSGGVAYAKNYGPRIGGIEHADCRVR